MSTSDNPVPLPFVTELPPMTMNTKKSSPSLTKSKSSNQPAHNTSINQAQVDDEAMPEVKETVSSKDNSSGNGVPLSLISGDSVDNPVSPKTSIAPRRYHFEHKDEKDLHFYIAKAHTSVRQGHPTTSSDKDKDLAKLSEMVSQMTHLLAASGVGRDTAVRALAYMAGPEKPEPKHALVEAMNDRRRKRNARRDVSGGSNKSNEAKQGDEDKRDAEPNKDAINTSESSNPPNTLDNATTASDNSGKAPNEHDTSSTVVPVTDGTNQGNKAATTNGEGNGKKSVGRRRWWQRRNRGRNNQQSKGREIEDQKENANGAAEETKATNGAEAKAETADKDKDKDATPLGSSTNAAATAA